LLDTLVPKEELEPPHPTTFEYGHNLVARPVYQSCACTPSVRLGRGFLGFIENRFRVFGDEVVQFCGRK
jgi:hypothetical protein